MPGTAILEKVAREGLLLDMRVKLKSEGVGGEGGGARGREEEREGERDGEYFAYKWGN